METPDAVMTYSPEGLNGMSRNLHEFVNSNLVPSYWRYRWYNRYLEQRMCIRKKPADSSVTCLVVCNRLLFLWSDDLRFSLKSSYYSVDCIKEILLVDSTLILSCCCKSCLVAYICKVCS